MHIAIIGNGIAGTTLATTLKDASDFQITLISEESPLPFARTSLMYLFTGDVRWEDTLIYSEAFWKDAGINRVMAKVKEVDTADKSLILADGTKMNYDMLVLATGSKPHRPSWWRENLHGISSLYHLDDLYRITNFVQEKPSSACIAGGGLIGVELAEMLLHRGIPTTMIIREQSFMSHWLPSEESVLISGHLAKKGVDLLFEDEIEQITGTENRIENVRLKGNRIIPCQFLGVTTGVLPDTELAYQAGILINKGILVDERLETSSPGIYAIGDCTELRSPAAQRQGTEAVWYVAKEMGRQLAEILLKKRIRYEPACWFNSASFFSLQMQVYGIIHPAAPTGMLDLYWQHPAKRISVRIQADAASSSVKGFLTIGLRLRHAVCEQWITQNTPVHAVLRDWHQAVFEPEFSHRYISEIQKAFAHLIENKNAPSV